MNRFLNIIKLLKSAGIPVLGDLIYKELIRRIYSNEVVYVSYFDLTRRIEVPEPSLPLTLRPLVKEDIPELLVKHSRILDTMELKTRLSILLFINSGVKTCYVGVTGQGKPVVMNWLLTSEMNDKIQCQHGDGIRPLKHDEVLCEFLFIDQDYRGLHLNTWSTMKLFLKAKELGASRAIAYSPKINVLSWEVAKKIGWTPYLVKYVNRRIFRRKITFSPYGKDSTLPIG
jgi:hypothetical protein